MTPPWPPTVDTIGGLLDNDDLAIQQYNDAQRAALNAIITMQTAINNGTLTPRTYKYTYDFAVQGGSVGAKTLTAASGQLPAGFVIDRTLVDVITAFTGGAGAEVAISTGVTADDIIAAGTLANLGLDTVVRIANASGVKTITVENPILTISVAALTAGKLTVYITGWLVA